MTLYDVNSPQFKKFLVKSQQGKPRQTTQPPPANANTQKVAKQTPKPTSA